MITVPFEVCSKHSQIPVEGVLFALQCCNTKKHIHIVGIINHQQPCNGCAVTRYSQRSMMCRNFSTTSLHATLLHSINNCHDNCYHCLLKFIRFWLSRQHQ